MATSALAYPLSRILPAGAFARAGQLRLAKYLWVYERDLGTVFLANLLNHAVVRLTGSEFEILRRSCASNEPSVGADGWVHLLVEHQFLVRAPEHHEESLLRQRLEVGETEPRNFGITLGVTMKCNFRCTYCYQNVRMKRMTEETLRRIREHVLRRMVSVQRLGVVWFGGEPLLEVPTIISMSAFLISECERHGVSYEADLVTNGYLLTRNVAEELARARVSSVQVTLDGTELWHDRSRPLHSGEGTFNRIMDNLRNLGTSIPNVRIRVNVSEQNIDDLASLVDRLAELDCRVLLYLVPVHRMGTRGTQLDPGHFSNFQRWRSCIGPVEQYAMGRGVRVLTSRHVAGLPYCNGYSRNCMVVDPEANVYYCVSDIGRPNRREGVLTRDGTVEVESGSECMASPDPFRELKCTQCDVFPLCMGGCYHLPMASSDANGRCMMKSLIAVNLPKAIDLGLRDPVGEST